MPPGPLRIYYDAMVQYSYCKMQAGRTTRGIGAALVKLQQNAHSLHLAGPVQLDLMKRHGHTRVGGDAADGQFLGPQIPTTIHSWDNASDINRDQQTNCGHRDI